jgi:hypothetical protein
VVESDIMIDNQSFGAVDEWREQYQNALSNILEQ